MKAFFISLILTVGFLFVSSSSIHAQGLQKIEIQHPPGNFSKLLFLKQLKTYGMTFNEMKEIGNMDVVVRSLFYENGKWYYFATQHQIDQIQLKTEGISISNGLHSAGMTGTNI